MKKEMCPDLQIGQQPADQLPWCHLVTLLAKVSDPLKVTAFKPDHAGQLNFHLTAVDARIEAPDDAPIGLLLCKTKNRRVAEWVLSDIEKPMGVAEYQLVRALPEPLDTSLSTIEEIEAELAGGVDD